MALAAVTDLRQRLLQRLGQLQASLTLALEQMKRHALGRLRPDAGQAAQSLHQLIDQWAEFHRIAQKGILKPPGIFMPCVRPDIMSRLASSTRRTASFTAAASRSSRISLSSLNTDGSMVTRLTSWPPVITTYTSPAPTSPVTSALAIFSCAFCICSCSCCACFIRSPTFGFIGLPRVDIDNGR